MKVRRISFAPAQAQRIVDLLGAEACVAAFHVEYDGGRNACVALNHSSSRLTELASALHDKEHKLTTSKPSSEGATPPHREGRMGEGFSARWIFDLHLVREATEPDPAASASL
ncbi:hypothetical protein MRX96_007869 [Rhipicephalus microplus]